MTRGHLRWAVLASVLGLTSVARAAAAQGPPLPSGELLDALGADVIVFDTPRPPAPTEIALGARVAVSVERLRALVQDPKAYARAIPSFLPPEILKEHPGPGGLPPSRLVAWELEIPLWNLEGKLWMRPRPDGVDLELVEGDLLPGRLRLTAAAHGAGSVLWVQGRLNLREANFMTRRLAARHYLTEPAMTVTAAYVLLRALALEADRRGPVVLPQRWPKHAMSAPDVGRIDGVELARLVAARFDGRHVVGAVRSRPDGRLHHVELAVTSRRSPDLLAARLNEAWRWQAIPGWKRVDVRAATAAGAVAQPAPTFWEVDSNLPFVDFDTTWQVVARPRFRALAPRGDWSGPALGWDLVPGRAAGQSVAVLLLHPRIDNVGYVPRRLIAAEPLLEHGLSLGLAYVNAVSLVRALEP